MFGFVSIITFQVPRVDFPVYNAYLLLIGSQIEGLILFLTLWLILCHPLIKENLKTGLHDTREVFLLMLHWHKKMMINALISRVAYWRYCNLLDCFLNSWFSSALNYIQVKFITYLGQEVLYKFFVNLLIIHQFSCQQGCALAAPGRLRWLTFGLGRLKKKSRRLSRRIDL